MKRRSLDPSLQSKHIIRGAIAESPFIILGVLSMVMWPERGTVTGIVLIALGAAIGSAFGFKALFTLKCPNCKRPCTRLSTREFKCDACQILWERIPSKK